MSVSSVPSSLLSPILYPQLCSPKIPLKYVDDPSVRVWRFFQSFPTYAFSQFPLCVSLLMRSNALTLVHDKVSVCTLSFVRAYKHFVSVEAYTTPPQQGPCPQRSRYVSIPLSLVSACWPVFVLVKTVGSVCWICAWPFLSHITLRPSKSSC